MVNNTSAPVTRAPVSTFECSCCLLDTEEAATLIDSNPVCAECIKESIVPRFHEALKHEFNYPVEWSPSVSLDPDNFKDFFEDYRCFIKAWVDREREYKTPGGDRLYCKNGLNGDDQTCDAFVGNRTKYLFDVALCPHCEEWICSKCGIKTGEHACKIEGEGEDISNLDGVVRCPRGCLVTLEDGCNDVNCGCGAHLCAVCGTRNPKDNHWSRGNPCPRFGRPGDERAMFNEDLAEVEDENEETGVEESIRVVFDTARRVQHEAILLAGIRPNGVVVSPEQVSRFMGQRMARGPGVMMDSQNRALELLPNPGLVRGLQWVMVAEHRGVLESFAHWPQAVEFGLVHPDMLEANPDLGEQVQHVAVDLIPNLDLYVEFDRVKAAYDDYARRHEEIMHFIHHMMLSGSLGFWPKFYSILAVYKIVAPGRLQDAAPQSGE